MYWTDSNGKQIAWCDIRPNSGVNTPLDETTDGNPIVSVDGAAYGFPNSKGVRPNLGYALTKTPQWPS